jgi:lysophospholipid acyltransferase (LPLAT)-like uncharacterized protein
MRSPLLNRLALALLPRVGAGAISLLGRTMAIRTEGAAMVDDLYGQGRSIIIAFWHGRQLMMPLAYRGRKAHILISQHRDGELIQRVVSRFGFDAVRGSTTRGGAAALRRLIAVGRAGGDVVVTPDGPKGPRQVAQPGAVLLAKATGLPIVPLTFACSKKKSSKVGTAFCFPIRSAAHCSSGESRCGSRPMPRRSMSNPHGVTWRRS